MDIYSILSSKPHNPHYLNRYITFIEKCQQKNVGYEGPLENHHICPKADDMFPEYVCFKTHPWNCAVLTARQHFIAHLILWKCFYEAVSCEQSLWFMSNGNWKQYSNYSKRYKLLRKEISERMKNKISVKDKEGKTSRVSLDDPRYLSGELVSINTGMVATKDKEGKTSRVSLDDPRYLSGELVGITKGFRVVINSYGNKFMSDDPNLESIHKNMIPIKTEDGNIVKVRRDSNEWLSGKYQAQHKDTITVKDKDGNMFRVQKDDPRYLSGELVGVVKDTITVKDKDGNMFRVQKDDPRYLSGELVGSMKGKITINDGTRNKRIDLNSTIPEGWVRGMIRKSKKS